MVDSWLTVLQSYTESLRTACLLGLLHDVDAPKRLVVIWMHTHAHTWTHIYYVDTYIQVGQKKIHIDTENRWFTITIMLPLSDI